MMSEEGEREEGGIVDGREKIEIVLASLEIESPLSFVSRIDPLQTASHVYNHSFLFSCLTAFITTRT